MDADKKRGENAEVDVIAKLGEDDDIETDAPEGDKLPSSLDELYFLFLVPSLLVVPRNVSAALLVARTSNPS